MPPTWLSPLLELRKTNSGLVLGDLDARQNPPSSKLVIEIGGRMDTRAGPRLHLAVWSLQEVCTCGDRVSMTGWLSGWWIEWVDKIMIQFEVESCDKLSSLSPTPPSPLSSSSSLPSSPSSSSSTSSLSSSSSSKVPHRHNQWIDQVCQTQST